MSEYNISAKSFCKFAQALQVKAEPIVVSLAVVIYPYAVAIYSHSPIFGEKVL